MEQATIKVSIFEDNKSLLDGLSQLIECTPGFELYGAYHDCSNLIHDLKLATPDVVLMDIHMPGINGIEGVQMIRKHFPEVKILMQTIFDDDDMVFQSICAGASGYLLKNTPGPRLIEAIHDVIAGGAPMSPVIASKVLNMFQKNAAPGSGEVFILNEKEKQVLSFLTQGLSYKMIASELNITIDGVRFYIRKIYEKLHVHSMTEAVSKALKHKLV
ncbi:MAG: response regulator [Chitinophagales bacterium]